MEDVHIYLRRPAGKEGDGGLEEIGEALKELACVAGVDTNASANVVAVSYEGGGDEREEIKRTIEAAGYEISRLSVRSQFEEPERGLWDI